MSVQIHVIHHSISLAFSYIYLQRLDCGHDLEVWKTIFKLLNLNNSPSFHPEEQCRRVILLYLFVVGFAVPNCLFWILELNSRIRYLSTMYIALSGHVPVYYMAAIFTCASLFVWLMILTSI